MEIRKYQEKIPRRIYQELEARKFTTLRPAQYKAIDAGLFEGKNLLICTPTASGKTLVAELAALQAIYHDKAKALYVVPLRALASEKHKTFTRDYPGLRIGVSSGDFDAADAFLDRHDLIITTSEKLDSLMRHNAPWIPHVGVVIFDEIHLLNDVGRGPTLEIVITLLRRLLPKLQIIALSATIGNPKELAKWLQATLIEDRWRPVRLDKGIYLDGEVEFY